MREPYFKSSGGFSLIEILSVMAIAILFIAMSSGVYFSFRQKNQIDVEAQKVLSLLRFAQNQALASQNFLSHGVHFDSGANTYTLFEGAAFDPLDTANEISTLGNNTQFFNIQLTGAATDIIFNRISGSTTQNGFIEISDKTDTQELRVVCVEAVGSAHVLALSETSADCEASTLEYTGGATATNLAAFPGTSGSGDPAQSFTQASDTSVKRVDLYLMQAVSPSNIFLEIREGGSAGTVIGKSNMVDGSTLPGSLSWVQFSFPSAVDLSASTQYFLRLRSLPDSTVPFSGAVGTIYWGYEHSASAPPAYGGGDAWRYVGANDNPTSQGQQLGPADQYDFSFRIFSSDSPDLTDSRHLEFDLGFSIRDNTNFVLTFNGSTTEIIPVADFMNALETEFFWEDAVSVGGSDQTVRIHSLFIDDYDTILSVHRDQRLNDTSLLVEADSTDIVTYTALGVPTKAVGIESMVYR